jgi:hypothetical protein
MTDLRAVLTTAATGFFDCRKKGVFSMARRHSDLRSMAQENFCINVTELRLQAEA